MTVQPGATVKALTKGKNTPRSTNKLIKFFESSFVAP
jgi:hypothetical protein